MVLGIIDERFFAPLAALLVRRRVRPSHLTLLQAPVFALQLKTGLEGSLFAFWCWMAVGTILDGADGVYARLSNQVSAAGKQLDAAFDLLGIGVVLTVAAALHQDVAVWCMLVGAANVVLFFRPARRRRAGPFNRGPIVLGLLFEPLWPGAVSIGVLIPLVVAALTLLIPGRAPSDVGSSTDRAA